MTTHASGDPSTAETAQGAHRDYAKGDLSSLGVLIGEITSDLSALVRQELALAKAELRVSATRASKGAGMLAGAGGAASYVVLFLSIALWWWLGDVLNGRGLAALVVAGLWLVVAVSLALAGRAQLKKVQGMPQTVDSAKQVPAALKGNENTP